MDTLEKSADALDTASQLQEHMNEQALAGVRAKSKPQSHPDFDGESCLDCGIEMPLLRLAMCRIRCVQCETVIENQNKLRGR